jgi:hypothetical protein
MAAAQGHQQINHKAAALVEVEVEAGTLALKAQMAVLEPLDKDSQVVAAILL